MKRYEVECTISRIADDVQEEYNLNNNFYGDCYPDEIMDLENKMELEDKEELHKLIDEAIELFKSYAESEVQ